MVSTFCVLAILFFTGSALQQYCPKANDLEVAYGSPTIRDGGWTLSGGGGASTKSAFNLIGGSVEFDIDFSHVALGVNANIYTISPTFNNPSAAFDKNANYCDGQGASGSAQYCIEIDWIESNGACGGATTIHTVPGGGSGPGCTAWGCTTTYNYGGVSSFHMKISHAADGTMTVVRSNGATLQTISQSTYSPQPGSSDINTLANVYASKGAVIYSSLWTGWVPTPNGCNGGSYDLGNSYFTVSNLKITGTVVQGPTPTLCGIQSPVAPVPPVAPIPAPVAPVALPHPIINWLSTPNSIVPTSGSFQVQVNYQAFENSRIAVDILDSSNWAWLGGATYDVSSGSGTVTVSVSPTSSIPVVGTIKLKAWIVNSANIGKWAITSGTNAEQFLSVTVGSSQPNPVPVPNPVPNPVTTQAVELSVGCSAVLFGNGNNDYWNAIKVSIGARSAKITCADTSITSSCVFAWTDYSDSHPVFNCPMSGICKNPTPSCSSSSGSRLDSEEQTDAGSAGLAGWAIALIVLAGVLVVLIVVAVGLYTVRSPTSERI